jgi:hypothetical protein
MKAFLFSRIFSRPTLAKNGCADSLPPRLLTAAGYRFKLYHKAIAICSIYIVQNAQKRAAVFVHNVENTKILIISNKKYKTHI